MLDAFVLVVDDNPETVNMVAKALELDGIKVRTATNVLRALEAMHDGSSRPSLIITDLLMPRTTGWDFLKHLRNEASTRTLPVIVITGVEPGDSEALADLVIQKPVDPVQLSETVRTMLIAHSKAS